MYATLIHKVLHERMRKRRRLNGAVKMQLNTLLREIARGRDPGMKTTSYRLLVLVLRCRPNRLKILTSVLCKHKKARVRTSAGAPTKTCKGVDTCAFSRGFPTVVPLYRPTMELLHAVNEGNISRVSSLLRHHMADPNAVQKALIMAAQRGHAEIVYRLLEAFANPNGIDDPAHRRTALTYAARQGHTDVVKVLLQHGGHVNHLDARHWTPLHWAASKGHAEIFAWLLAFNANPNAYTDGASTPLGHAARNGHADIVDQLLHAAANVNHIDGYDMTPLVYAARGNHAEIVHALLSKQADPDLTGANNWSALMWAVNNNHTKNVKQLLQAKANVNYQCMDGGATALMLAADGADGSAIARKLLDAKANPNLTNDVGSTALIIAAHNSDGRVVGMLLNAGTNVNHHNDAGRNALDTAYGRLLLRRFGRRLASPALADSVAMAQQWLIIHTLLAYYLVTVGPRGIPPVQGAARDRVLDDARLVFGHRMRNAGVQEAAKRMMEIFCKTPSRSKLSAVGCDKAFDTWEERFDHLVTMRVVVTQLLPQFFNVEFSDLDLQVLPLVKRNRTAWLTLVEMCQVLLNNQCFAASLYGAFSAGHAKRLRTI